MSMVRVVLGWLRALAGLVWPVDCAGCGEPDVALCARCRLVLGGEPMLLPGGAGPVPVWTLTAYGGTVADLIAAWKERGRHDLSRPFGVALGRAATACVTNEIDQWPPPGEQVWLVPMPARFAARRERGADLPHDLARWASASDRNGFRAVRVLRHVRRVRDQVGLGHAERQRNLAGAFGVRASKARSLSGRRCIVIDDIVTTGASVTEAVRVLRAGGARVVGVCCLSVTFRQRGVPDRPEATSLHAWKAPSGSRGPAR